MQELLLKASVKAEQALHRGIARVQDKVEANRERGDVVQNVILIGIGVIGAVLIGGFILNALGTQGEKLEGCISGVNNIKTGCSQFTNG